VKVFTEGNINIQVGKPEGISSYSLDWVGVIKG